MKWISYAAAALCLMVISGCVMPPLVPPGDPSNPLKRVAVLPLQNDTNDVDAPEFVRQRLVAALEMRYYTVQPLDETDQLLRDRLGISIGGQVDMAQPTQLGEVLGVEGLFHGTLMDFAEVTTGVYNVRKVRGVFRLVNALDGSIFWEKGLGVKSQEGHGGAAGSATVMAAGIAGSDEAVPWVIIDSRSDDEGVLTGLALGLGSKLISKAAGTHLKRETDEMIRRLFQTLPVGPGEATVAAAAAPGPGVPPAAPIMPMPAMAHMDFGDRDFKAVMTITTVDKGDQQTYSYTMPLAKAGDKLRMEMDYAAMAQDEDVPEAFRSVVMIHDGDAKTSYQLYPAQRKYIRIEESAAGFHRTPDVRRQKVGEAVVDGHPTEKYEIVVTYEGEQPQRGFVWNALDLDGMTIKSEMENDSAVFTMLLKDVVLGTPEAEWFVIPADYTEAGSYMEIYTQQQ